MVKPNLFSRGPGLVSQALHALVSQIPISAEPPHRDPTRRASELAKNAAMKAAAVSGSFSLPFGPLGLATVIPDLLAVWRIQQQLVADIAATYGKGSVLSHETMAFCLFKHGGAAIFQRFVSKAGDDVLVQRIANRTLQQLLEKIAIRITQRLAAKSVSRWLPILGALGAGAYAYYDTTHVATNAIELFSKDVRFEELPAPADAPAPAAAAAVASTPTSKRKPARTKSAKPTGHTSPGRKPRARTPARKKSAERPSD